MGKSYLIAVYCCIRAILYPNSKIIVASATKGQAKLLISQKIDKELRLKYPNLAREIADIKVGANESVVIFKNGSTIEAVVSNDNARGYRGHILIVDEFRMVKNDVIQKVLKPFLNVCRKPAFTSKKEYENYPLEENKEFYMSSAWYKQHYSWDKFKGFVKSMCRGEKFFACDLNYRLAVHHNLLSESRVEAIRNEDDMNPITWDLEMEGLFVGETEGALYKFDEINPCRTITKPFIPRSDQEWAMNKKTSLKKIDGEKRVIGFDVALMGRVTAHYLGN